MEIAMLGSSSWMPCAPQGVKGTDDDDDDVLHKYLWVFTHSNTPLCCVQGQLYLIHM
jgi:hypothetical protein